MDIMKEASQIFQDDGLEMIGAMLIAPDEEFDAIKGTVLDVMREAANRKENQSQWSALVKQSGFTKEKYIEELNKVDDLIENEMGEYSETKKDFMRQFFTIIYNAIIESFDKNKRIIQNETNIEYDEAVDITPCNFTYRESENDIEIISLSEV